jgi:cytochrome c2
VEPLRAPALERAAGGGLTSMGRRASAEPLRNPGSPRAWPSRGSRARRALPLALASALALAACAPRTTPGAALGDPQRGRELIAAAGCGACHTIPGVSGARGMVGPPLGDVGRRAIIAGMLPNTPDNLAHWIQAPQSVVPGNAMPNMELTDHDARDIAAYLYTLR